MITIKVPATSANLGPGFDCLGLAVSMYNTVEVEPSKTLKIEIFGEGSDSIPKNGSNLIFKAYRRTMQHLEEPVVNLHMVQHNKIPSTRGLGSSSTAIVAGILIASEISGKAIPRAEALRIATEIEGHPDNVAPALYGGFTVSMQKDKQVRSLSFEVSNDLVPVAMVPNFELSTAKARNVLPQHVPRRKGAGEPGAAAQDAGDRGLYRRCGAFHCVWTKGAGRGRQCHTGFCADRGNL